MGPLNCLFEKYDRLFLFDTETTGLLYNRDEIIEFAAVVLERRNGEITVVEEYDQLITLSPGGFVPTQIEALTGITNQDIRERGIPKTRVCCDIARMVAGNTLLLAYNAHFDLSFLFYMLLRDGDPTILRGKDKLDLLTVYKDRRSYPHKLCNAIGLKTGYTEKAGNCLVSAFFEEDTVWLIGVFGCASGNENRYKDTLAIYNSL